VDSESGGAKGHYPNCITRKANSGSRRFEKKSHFRKNFLKPVRLPPVQEREEEPNIVTKPPESTPHSDIDGVHRDEKPNVESAVEAGQGGEDLERAGKEDAARPDYSDDVKNRDDRSR
jgi:hypothetical protein